MVKIVETVASSVTSTKQHIWFRGHRCEERDGSGNSSKRFFTHGQINSSTNYFYNKDHLGSIRTMTDDNGDVQAAYSFAPYGRAKKLDGPEDSDFQFAGYYLHARSGLNLTHFRAYSPTLGGWISRDPSGAPGDRKIVLTTLGQSFSNPEFLSAVDTSVLIPAALTGSNPANKIGRMPKASNLFGQMESYAYLSGNPLNGTDSLGLFPGVECVVIFYPACILMCQAAWQHRDCEDERNCEMMCGLMTAVCVALSP